MENAARLNAASPERREMRGRDAQRRAVVGGAFIYRYFRENVGSAAPLPQSDGTPHKLPRGRLKKKPCESMASFFAPYLQNRR